MEGRFGSPSDPRDPRGPHSAIAHEARAGSSRLNLYCTTEYMHIGVLHVCMFIVLSFENVMAWRVDTIRQSAVSSRYGTVRHLSFDGPT